MKCIHCHGSGEEPVRVAPVQHNFKSAAKEIREAAKEVREKTKTVWKGEPDMQAMVIADAKDMREVAKLLGAGNALAAANKAGGMDTAARDNIPDDAWIFMQREAQRCEP